MTDQAITPGAGRAADIIRDASEERYRLFSRVLESFTATLDFDEVLHRIATVTREELDADRVLLVHPIKDDATSATVRFAVNAPGTTRRIETGEPTKLTPALMRRALQSSGPIAVYDGDPDATQLDEFGIRASLFEILRPQGDEPWGFGVHSCTPRQWTPHDIEVFSAIARYATIALTNTLLHQRAIAQMAQAAAVLDQIPDAAMIYNVGGTIERMNQAAIRDWSDVGSTQAPPRAVAVSLWTLDGTEVAAQDLPSSRALRGENVKGDFRARDPRTHEERVISVRATPIRDAANEVIGALALIRDMTDERQAAERELHRRRRADALASLSLEMATAEGAAADDLTATAQRVAKAISGIVRIYFYRPATGLLELCGFAGTGDAERFRDYFSKHPYRVGEGMPGAVFQIGRPLLFFDIRGDAIIDFARDDEERAVKRALNEQSLIAAPIEAYGERLGAIIISQSDPRRNFDAEDLEFAQAVAERVGAARHIHELTRMSLEGHRAADELARREVDARVRFEAVIETAPVGIAVVSADELRFEMVNARWVEFASLYGKISPDTRLTGLRADEVITDLEVVLKHVGESGETQSDEAMEI
ncbi:MAG TPA: GAF domain-containing protein, partial [Thermoanaerobaculia bacterium]|nr:GAF domain-containing protein [Thermoanaerobaculia bacterium]